MNVVTDPLFYPLAIIAVTALGLSKGGFAGVGVMSTPLLATILPPLQAAAILLPILIVQDMISIWVYRRDWSAWHLKVMLPGGLLGIGIAWALAAQVSDAFVRLVVGLIGVSFALNAWFGRQSPATRPRSTATPRRRSTKRSAWRAAAGKMRWRAGSRPGSPTSRRCSDHSSPEHRRASPRHCRRAPKRHDAALTT
jgi:uncharacterized membrane protein YfcA